MGRTKLKKLFIVALTTLLPTTFIQAQDTTQEKKDMPFCLEASLELGTKSQGLWPFGAVVNIGYAPIKNFSIYIVGQNDLYAAKNGTIYGSSNFNHSFNLGGGIGYTFLPAEQKSLGSYELRVQISSSLKGKACKNTMYSAGLYWYGKNKHIVPIIGVGYKIRDFRLQGMKTHHAAFASLGIRF